MSDVCKLRVGTHRFRVGHIWVLEIPPSRAPQFTIVGHKGHVVPLLNSKIPIVTISAPTHGESKFSKTNESAVQAPWAHLASLYGIITTYEHGHV